MPILIINNLEHPRGLVLDDRVLIGRRPFNTIMVPDPSVSRIHAWIAPRDGRYVIRDAGSRAGTLVNGQPIAKPRALADGDEIRVGPATLIYMDADDLPPDVQPVEPHEPPPAADPYDGGIYFDCACGGPMWVTADMAGSSGRCRYCGERLVVPHTSGQLARPLVPAADAGAKRLAEQRARSATSRRPPAPPVMTTMIAPPPPERRAALCSICQSEITSSEERTTCPSCHLTFHAQCWQENYGCSAYGCDQVNVLAPPPETPANEAAASVPSGPFVPFSTDPESPAAPPQDSALSTQHSSSSWDLFLLAASFVAMGLGALAYGIPSAAMVLLTIAFLAMGKARRKSLSVVALAVAVVGTAAGFAASMLWWRNVRVWEMFWK